MVYDRNDHDGPEFAKEVAGLLGDFSTSNQQSVENLTKQLWKKFLFVENFQNQIHTTEETIRSRMNQDFEKVRASDRKQIKNI